IERHGRRAHHLGVVRHIFEHRALGRNLDAVSDLEMARKPALARDGNMIAQLGRTGDTDLRDKQAMLTDFHVVPDLDQVVDFGPLAYYRLAQGRAIDRRPGPDLNVILDPDDSDLRDLVMLAIVHGEAVPIGADDDTGVNDAPATDARAIGNDYTGIDN